MKLNFAAFTSCIFDLLFFRFIKYINAYRVYQQNYDQPEFLDPPQFLREYETQVRTFSYQPLGTFGNRPS